MRLLSCCHQPKGLAASTNVFLLLSGRVEGFLTVKQIANMSQMRRIKSRPATLCSSRPTQDETSGSALSSPSAFNSLIIPSAKSALDAVPDLLEKAVMHLSWSEPSSKSHFIHLLWCEEAYGGRKSYAVLECLVHPSQSGACSTTALVASR